MTDAPSMLSVFDGRICLGWIINRGVKGWEAMDATERSLGLFPSQKAAADAVFAAAEEGGR